MSRGTTNLARRVDGDPVPAAQANDVSALLTSTDDDFLYETLSLEPPTGASATNVNTGVKFVRNGPGVVGNASARTITIAPVRVARSSISSAAPRDVLSQVTQFQTDVALPAAPAGNTWGFLLVYARLLYVDPSDPARGAVVFFAVAEPASYVALASAAGFALLPAHTASGWNIPICYVKSYTGQTSIANEDILEYPDAISIATAGHRTLRSRRNLGGLRVGRAYSSANNSPAALMTGGSSFYVGGASAPRGKDQVLTATATPVSVARNDWERVELEILIPSSPGGAGNGGTGGTEGVAQTWVVDDLRDWRGANFESEWLVPGDTGSHFAEEDASVGPTRRYPAMLAISGGTAMHRVVGQSWVAVNPHAIFGSKLWAAIVGSDSDVPGTGSRNGVSSILAAGAGTDGWGLFVDPTTGSLNFYAKRDGVGAGPPVWILLTANFANHRPL